ncbi:MAG: hypothetical protein KOO63_14080 [Bacteroidales bacterium]|nr:hypothetical protein [Candidatus Latescibacterota bacterium]
MQGECKLCRNNCDLQNSHIVPAFVYRWLKETSPTGHLRSSEQPNLRRQDGQKEYWLCSDCEGMFGEWENLFATEVFRPTAKSSTRNIPYREWMLKFAVSLTWRVLTYVSEFGDVNHLSAEQSKQADLAREEWALFLLGKVPHPGPYEQHMLLTDEIASHDGGELPTNINRYLLRSIDIDVVANPKEAIVYVGLPRVILIGFISVATRKKWKGTKLHVKKGTVGPDRTEVPGELFEYIVDKAGTMQAMQRNLSTKQKRKVNEAFHRNAAHVHETDGLRAMDADFRLFGDAVFEGEDDSQH